MPEPQAGDSRLMSVRELLELQFNIPQFQRPYDWGATQVDDLINDLAESSKTNSALFLGLVVLHPLHDEFAVVDGQQRLTTLMLALSGLEGAPSALRTAGGLRRPWIRPRSDDVNFVVSLLSNNAVNPETLSQWLLKRAHERLQTKRPNIETLLNSEVIVYVAPSLSGATRLFERINLRGKEVSQFDLVKNKLIEWSAEEANADSREALVQYITRSYDKLFRLLDPRGDSPPFNSDKLLRQHWILASDAQFKSGERVLDRLTHSFGEKRASGLSIGKFIGDYLDSLVRVTELWVWVERPYSTSKGAYSNRLRQALLDFAKLNRESELQPIILASILKWGDNADKVVRFCEIGAFRSALAKKQANFGRSVKWRLSRQLFAGTLKDAQNSSIETPDDLIHQLFWNTTPYWNNAEAIDLAEAMTPETIANQVVPETAFENPDFLIQYRHLVHYLFWKYGHHLLTSKRWAKEVKMDINPFQESLWFEAGNFQQWDIEHIYPVKANDIHDRAGRNHAHLMKDYLNHLGNITVLPIRDNRGMQNMPFEEKLGWLQEQAKLPFNELLSVRSYTGNHMTKPHWGPSNCRKRAERIVEEADAMWGQAALQRIGIQPYDVRIEGYAPDEDDELETD